MKFKKIDEVYNQMRKYVKDNGIDNDHYVWFCWGVDTHTYEGYYYKKNDLMTLIHMFKFGEDLEKFIKKPNTGFEHIYDYNYKEYKFKKYKAKKWKKMDLEQYYEFLIKLLKGEQKCRT